MAAVMIQLIPSFNADCSKNNRFFLQLHIKITFYLKVTVLLIMMTSCAFSPNCRYHILLIGDIDELLHKLDAFCCTYQQVYSITYSSTDSVEKLVPRVDKCLILCKGQSSLTKENREVDKIPSSANKRL